MKQIINDLLSRISLGEAQNYGNLALYPLFNALPAPKRCLTLDEAQALSGLLITEVSDSGSVPELLLKNQLDQAVFLLDGEELVGAKQNRVLNLSVLASAGSSITIPVSCVERGRWSLNAAEFKSANRTHFARGRARKMASVSANLRDLGRACSNQGEVWADIDREAQRLATRSETGAMAAIFEGQRESLEQYVAAFTADQGQAGALFVIGGRPVGFDLFSAPDMLAALLPKLVRSYALDAIDSKPEDDGPPAIAPDALLTQVDASEIEIFESCGQGQDVRLIGEQTVAGALVDNGEVIHLAAFLRQDERCAEVPRSGASMSRASRRRVVHTSSSG